MEKIVIVNLKAVELRREFGWMVAGVLVGEFTDDGRYRYCVCRLTDGSTHECWQNIRSEPSDEWWIGW